jgi:type II restriction/modification system DNA methylase subunit YeeA
MTSARTPQDVVATWRRATLSERSSYQQHFLDLCALVGQPAPAVADPEGTFFTFEAGAQKQSGGQGWADVWYKGRFAWEYKGKHANLDKAYQQLLQYREALENPPLLIVSDIDTIQIHTNFTNTVKRVTTLTLDDLLTPAGLRTLRNVFEAPESFKAPQTTEQVTRQAAQEFARLAELLRAYGAAPEAAAHFLIRLLFCLFAEDVGLLPNGLFSRLIARTRHRAPLFAEQLQQLFRTMATGGFFAMEDILHFNGSLFDNDTVLELDSEGLDILARVSTLDWGAIEPSILGTLFERSLDPAKRSQLGAHYTSREDILLIVEPVLMAPLRRRWAEVRNAAQLIVADRDTAKNAAQRTRKQNELRELFVSFAEEIASVRVLDPACGSGNFLYVALKQLLDLEKEVITVAGELGLPRFFPSVGPEQLRGIEVNEYAHELAQITVWIGYIQWLQDNGFGFPAQPILKPLDTIRQMDAILAFDEAGRPVEPAWPEAEVIIGNPPFLGGSKLRRELTDSYTETLWRLYEDRVPAGADLVVYWFERARALIETGHVKRAGLLATQAIRQGASRTILERIKRSGDIFMAWSDRPWILDGAAVRVSMVGFDGGAEQLPVLDGHIIQSINSNLTGSLDLTTARRLDENTGIAFKGSSKAGPFELDTKTAQEMLFDIGNPNGRPNSDVVKVWVSGQDVTHRSRGFWIIDFGVGMSESDAAFYEKPFEYVRKHVYPIRVQNRREIYAKKWWQHAEARPGMRTALKDKPRFIVTPRVSKHRVFAWISSNATPDDRLFVIARDDDYFFGVLHSGIHELWSLANSSIHGDGNEGGRPVYNNTTCFETFPFPWPPGREPADDPRVTAIAAAAQQLVAARDAWLNPPGAPEDVLKKRTLTNLYNSRPAWLDLMHQALDRAVLDAYDWPHDLGDEEILARLLALNLERVAKQGGVVASGVEEE